jgi:hypothetical protein
MLHGAGVHTMVRPGMLLAWTVLLIELTCVLFAFRHTTMCLTRRYRWSRTYCILNIFTASALPLSSPSLDL